MKRFYPILCAFLFGILFSYQSSAQVLEVEDFESGGSFPADYTGWDTGLPPFSIVENENPCSGDWSLEIPLFSPNPIYLEYISPVATGGDDILISFQYDIIDNNTGDPVTNTTNFGTIDLSFTSDGGTTWTIFDTIDQTNLPTQECSAYTFTVPSANMPTGSTFGFRLDGSWNTGDYTITVDDFQFIEQVDCIQPINVSVDESSITYTSADISWDDLNNTSPASWTVGYCLIEQDPDSALGQTFCTTFDVTTNSASLTNLSEGTEYYIYVRSNCDPANSSTSEWSPVTSFQTTAIGSDCTAPIEINLNPSNPVPGDLPYQDFNETQIFGNFISGAPGGSCGSSSPILDGYEVVYHYTSDTDDILTIDLTNLTPGVNAGVFVYEDCSDIGQFCIGGATSTGGSPIYLNSVFVDQGEDYYIVVASADSSGSPFNTNYQLYIDGFDCNNWNGPDSDTILQFVSGQVLSSFSNSPMGATSTISGATLNWYYDDNGSQGLPVTAPLNTIALQDQDSFWVTQNIFGCESPATNVIFSEFNCNTDLGGITASQSGQVCDEGTVTLNAAAGTDNLFWYTSQTGGELVGSGSSYDTPIIDEDTSFWVSEGFIGLEELDQQGALGPITSSSSSSNFGLEFDALQPFNIVTVQVYVTGSSGNLTISLEGENGEIASKNIYVAGGTTSSPTFNELDLFFDVPAAGSYRLVKSSGPSLLYEPSPSFPYELGDVGEITSGATASSTSSNYYYFFNWTVTNPTILCETSRTEVTAIVNETQPISVNSSDLYVCINDSVTLDAVSDDADYNYTWNWTDGSGSYTDSGQSIQVSPIENTVYEVTGVNPNTGCTFSEEIEVFTVGIADLPISPDSAEICLGETLSMGSGSTLYDFETMPAGWTTSNSSTPAAGASAASADWKLVQSPYSGAQGASSNDNSRFFISEAYNLGPGSSLTTSLTSPAYNMVGVTSASLEFYHYHRYYQTQDTECAVEVNTNGSGWIEVESFTSTVGEPNAFQYENIDLTDYVGVSNLQVRFTFSGDWGWYWAIDNVQINRDYLNGQTTWSPTTDLYFDEDGTMPYDGTATNEVFLLSQTPGQQTYTATLQINQCNDVSSSLVVDVLDVQAPQGNSNQTFVLDEIIDDLVVTGSNLNWYVQNSQGGYDSVTINTLLQDGETYYVTQSQGECESDFLAITAIFECPVPEGIDVEFSYNANDVDAIVFWEDPTDVDGIIDYYLVIYNSNGDVVYDSYISSDENFEEIEGLNQNEAYTLEISSICNYDTNNESAVVQEVFNTTLSSEDFTFSSLEYYPNPTENFVNLSNDLPIDFVEIYSITGQKIFSQSVNNTEVKLNMINYASGAYFINVKIDGSTRVLRVIKE